MRLNRSPISRNVEFRSGVGALDMWYNVGMKENFF